MHSGHGSLCHDNMFIYSRRISFGCEASFDDVIVYKLWKVLEVGPCAQEDMVVFVMIICLSIVGELVLVVRLA